MKLLPAASRFGRLSSSGFVVFFAILLAVCASIGGCSNSNGSGGGGGTGSGSGPTSANIVSGTASAGAPIINATVTLKDKNGNTSTGTTAADGTFTVNTGGLTPPFFVQVKLNSASGSFPAGAVLYSVSGDANATTHINVHVLTDLIVRSWFSAQGVNPDQAFSNPVNNPPPTPLAVQTIAQTVIQVMQLWFNQAGITVTAGTPANGSINLISSTFTASANNPSGLDLVLHVTAETLNAGTGSVTSLTTTNNGTTETCTPTYPGSGAITVNTTTTSGGTTTSESVSGVAPNTAQQSAITAITAQINNYFTALNNNTNTNVNTLAAALLPFYASDYENDGFGRIADSANFAGQVLGVTVASFQVLLVKSIDSTSTLADVVLLLNFTQSGQAGTVTNEIILKNEGGTWLLFGDQRVVSLGTQQLTWNMEGNASNNASCASNPGAVCAFINAGFDAPQGTMNTGNGLVGCSETSPQTVSGGGNIWPTATCNNTAAASGMILWEGTIGGGGGGNATIQDQFAVVSLPLTSLITAGPNGTIFTYNLKTAGGTAVQYQLPVNAGTNDFSKITSIVQGNTTLNPPAGTIGSYALGQSATVNYTLPKTFAIADVKVSVTVFDGIPGTGSVNSCGGGNNSAVHPGITATTASIPIPATDTCTNKPIKAMDIDVVAIGVNGDNARATVFAQ
jgi:hypothetical protein